MDIIAIPFTVYSGAGCLQKYFWLFRIKFMPDNIIIYDETQTSGEVRFSEKFNVAVINS